MDEAPAPLSVEVCYALPHRQWVWRVRLAGGSTVADAIARSGLSATLPDVRVDDAHLGIFSRAVTLSTPLRDGDRVEIYRPLQTDPKDARRRRADQNRSKRR
jgi:uncharacterized protein